VNWQTLTPEVIVFPLSEITYLYCRRISPLAYEVSDLPSELVLDFGVITTNQQLEFITLPN
jgi:hypothetical protein